jgi:hypothetical protein
VEYPAAWAVRRVSARGSISWGGHEVFLTEVLAGESVAFEPIDDRLWLVRFAAVPLARFDDHHRRLLPAVPAATGAPSHT